MLKELATRWQHIFAHNGDFHDPITHDRLTLLEFGTRRVQVGVRTVWFILGFNLLTLLALLLHHADAWNYFASWLAIMIEWLVGVFVFGQTGRDAVIMRHNAAVQDQQVAMEQRMMSELTATRQELAETRVENAEMHAELIEVRRENGEMRSMIAILCEHFGVELEHVAS